MSLSVAHVLLSFGAGGQERVVIDLVGAQTQIGYQVAAVSLSTGGDAAIERELRASGAEVVVVDKGSRVSVSVLPRLVTLFRRLGARLVHTHNPGPLIYAAPAARLAGARVVHTKHGEHRDSRVRMALRRASARCTDAFVAVSETTAAFARANRECALTKLSVIHNGTDLSRFGRDELARARIRGELGLPAEAWVIGSIGRLVPEKNHELLVRAVAPLLGPRAHLVIAGGGKREREVRAAVDASPARPYIHMIGHRGDVPALLAAIDLFAISSTTEGLPIGLIEAMASELPIVSTRVGGIGHVIADGETGLLVPPEDEAALRAALAQVHERPDLARNLARQARAAALSRFTAERMHHDYTALYERVLNG